MPVDDVGALCREFTQQAVDALDASLRDPRQRGYAASILLAHGVAIQHVVLYLPTVRLVIECHTSEPEGACTNRETADEVRA
jgi:hypothetical protein